MTTNGQNPLTDIARKEIATLDWCKSVQQQTTDHIDDLVMRLQSIKHAIALECAKTNHKMTTYITLCEDAMKAAYAIGQAVERLEQTNIPEGARRMKKYSKIEAEYTDNGTEQEHCHICKHYVNVTTCAMCAIIMGRISPEGWCKYFKKERDR